MSAEGILAQPGLYHNVLAHFHIRPVWSAAAADVSTTTESDVEMVAVVRSCAEGRPSLLALYREYCALSREYAALGGWEQLNRHYRRARDVKTAPNSAATVMSIPASEACPGAALDVSGGAKCHGTEAAAQSSSGSAVAFIRPGSGGELVEDSSRTGSKRNHAAVNNTAYIPEPRQVYIARQHLAWMLGKSGHGRMVRYVHLGVCYKKHVHLMQALNEAASIDELLAIADKCLPN
jgi:hypothetical protein